MTHDRALAVLAVVAALGLAACAAPEELRRKDEAACTSYGFARGTPDFAACLQRESLARRDGDTAGFGVSGGY
jgi:hypothetical protein